MNRLATCLSITSLALAACGSEPDPGAAAVTSRSLPNGAPADPMARMARAVGNGKPGAAVRFATTSRRSRQSAPDGTADRLRSECGRGCAGRRRQRHGRRDTGGTLSASFTEVEPAKPYMHTVSVLPDRTGVFYITVVATTQIGNQNLSRTFSIPFVVGNVPAQQKTAPQTDAAGEPIQPAKARETTKPGVKVGLSLGQGAADAASHEAERRPTGSPIG